MRYAIAGLLMMLGVATTANAAVSVNIGINLPSYPRLVAVPGYPVYYAPTVNSNYFFYDGLYWVLNDDGWYSSSWYNGPWSFAPPEIVPSYVLQVPVRYYRRPPVYFRGWGRDASPRWGDHWGRDWVNRRGDWNDRHRGARVSAAPLPNYQRQYSGNRYPGSDRQGELHSRNYNYNPRESVVQERYREQGVQRREERGQQGRGQEQRGNDNRGNEQRGNEQRGNEQRGENREARGGGGDGRNR
jgi:hypothetical protein